MGVRIPIRLRFVEDALRREHGSVRDLTLDEIRVLEVYARQIELDIEDAWPVDTGYSRDGWQSRVYGNYSATNEVRGIGILLWNRVGYVQYVRRRGEKAAGLSPLWGRLVQQVVNRYRAPLMADMSRAILRTEEQLRSGTDLLDIVGRVFRPRLRLVS